MKVLHCLWCPQFKPHLTDLILIIQAALTVLTSETKVNKLLSALT